MKKNDNRKNNSKKRSKIRIKIIDMLKSGSSSAAIARKTGYDPSTISKLRKQIALSENNYEAHIKVSCGRPRLISCEDDKSVFQMIVARWKGEDDSSLWDVEKILCKSKSSIKAASNKAQCFKQMKRLGFMFENQMMRVRKVAPDWYKNDYPGIVKNARDMEQEILFVDTKNISLNKKNVFTVYGAIALKGSLKFYVLPNAFSANGLIRFITLLLENRTKPLHLILEKYKECNTIAFKEYTKSVNKKLLLHFFTKTEGTSAEMDARPCCSRQQLSN